jgi:hypothetical protein
MEKDFANCGNPGCGARVLRRIAVHSISQRLYCGRKCLDSVTKAVPFERTIRVPAGDIPMNGSRIVRLHG